MKENDTNSKVGAICLPPETKSIITSQIDSINYSIAIPIEDHYASQLTLVRGTISVDKVGKGFVINRSAPNGDGFMYKYHNIKEFNSLSWLNSNPALKQFEIEKPLDIIKNEKYFLLRFCKKNLHKNQNQFNI